MARGAERGVRGWAVPARGNGATFQRNAYRRSGRLPAVVADAAALTTG